MSAYDGHEAGRAIASGLTALGKSLEAGLKAVAVAIEKNAIAHLAAAEKGNDFAVRTAREALNQRPR